MNYFSFFTIEAVSILELILYYARYGIEEYAFFGRMSSGEQMQKWMTLSLSTWYKVNGFKALTSFCAHYSRHWLVDMLHLVAAAIVTAKCCHCETGGLPHKHWPWASLYVLSARTACTSSIVPAWQAGSQSTTADKRCSSVFLLKQKTDHCSSSAVLV